MTKQFQNKVAESGLLFFVTAIYAASIWLLAEGDVLMRWPQLLCIMISTLLIRELSNSNSLIRIRTQLVPSIFLILTVSVPSLFESVGSYATCLCMIAFLFQLFKTYQDKKDSSNMYLAFLILGISIFINIHILFFVPIFWILTATQLQSLSWRTWSASLLGLFTPYWVVSPWIIYTDNWHYLTRLLEPLTNWHPFFDFSYFSFNEFCFLVLITVLPIVSLANFLHKSYEDRIRIRQLLVFFYIFFILTETFLILRPDLRELLIPILIICSSPIIAHFFALTHSKTSNLIFIGTIILFILVTVTGLVPNIEEYLVRPIDFSWIGL